MSDGSLPQSEIILYQTADGRTRIQCRFENETLWLTQAQIAELFQTTPQNVTLHLKAIYAEGELTEEATCRITYKFATKVGGRSPGSSATIGWRSFSPSVSASAAIGARNSACGLPPA
jgi:hypothetical protein